MSTIQVKRHALGSSMINNNPLEIKKVHAGSSMERAPEEGVEPVSNETGVSSVESDGVVETSAERRNRRKEEFREAASIRDRALQMQKQAEQQIRETQQFKTLIEQSREDPMVLAKALGMDLSEFQRKVFNKTYSIAEEPKKEKEETFEEQTQRRLAQYEQERSQDRERQLHEAQEKAKNKATDIKMRYIENNILPAITENHEFILANGKEYCAQLIYDEMNALYQDAAAKAAQAGRSFEDQEFTLTPADMIEQMEEVLCRQSEEQILKAKGMNKLKKHFSSGDSEQEYGIERKSFSPATRRVQPSPTLSNSLGSSAPPAALTGLSSTSTSTRRIPLNNRDARREAAKKILGQ